MSNNLPVFKSPCDSSGIQVYFFPLMSLNIWWGGCYLQWIVLALWRRLWPLHHTVPPLPFILVYVAEITSLTFLTLGVFLQSRIKCRDKAISCQRVLQSLLQRSKLTHYIAMIFHCLLPFYIIDAINMCLWFCACFMDRIKMSLSSSEETIL